jgi:hypothetical protein
MVRKSTENKVHSKEQDFWSEISMNQMVPPAVKLCVTLHPDY